VGQPLVCGLATKTKIETETEAETWNWAQVACHLPWQPQD